MKYQVTLTTETGYVFNHAFLTLEETREFMRRAALALMPGETLSFSVL